MTCRIEVKIGVKHGRFVDAIDLTTRIIAEVERMGGPPGLLFRDSVGGYIGQGLLITWDFADYAAWGAWEDGSAMDADFQALFAEVLAENGPYILPFERNAYTSLP